MIAVPPQWVEMAKALSLSPPVVSPARPCARRGGQAARNGGGGGKDDKERMLQREAGETAPGRHGARRNRPETLGKRRVFVHCRGFHDHPGARILAPLATRALRGVRTWLQQRRPRPHVTSRGEQRRRVARGRSRSRRRPKAARAYHRQVFDLLHTRRAPQLCALERLNILRLLNKLRLLEMSHHALNVASSAHSWMSEQMVNLEDGPNRQTLTKLSNGDMV